MNATSKTCTKCRETKSLDAFAPDARRKDGRQSRCRKCQYADRVEWKNAHPDLYRAQKRADIERNKEKRQAQKARWYQANREHCRVKCNENARERRRAAGCKERIHRTPEENAILRKEQGRAWRLANIDRARARARAYYQSHRDVVREKARQWKQANPDKIQASKDARRAILAQGDLTKAQWTAIVDRYEHRCAYCGCALRRAVQDHVLPIARGGKHTADNIVPACKACNLSKGQMTVDEWTKLQNFMASAQTP